MNNLFNKVYRGTIGNDVFHVNFYGQDVIFDFGEGDVIDLSATGGFGSFSDLSISTSGVDTVISASLNSIPNWSLTLEDYVGTLSDADFIFA